MRNRLVCALGSFAGITLTLACTVNNVTNVGGSDASVDGNGLGVDGSAEGSCMPKTIPATATGTADITLVGANFGDRDSAGAASAVAWKSVGYDLDGLCTTAKSTDVCTQADGSQKSAQTDGVLGIDNSFGENILPIFASVNGNTYFGQSSAIYLNIANGAGSITVAGNGGSGNLVIPLADAKIVTDGAGGGTLSGVVPTESFVNAMKAYAGRLSPSLCDGAAFDQIAQELRQASDIGADGAQTAGAACGGISIGLTFTSTMSAGTAPNPGPDPCAGG